MSLQCLPSSFGSIWPYGLGGDVVWRLSRWPPSQLNDFSNSESLCRVDASHQVSAQSDLWFVRRCHLKNFKMAAMAAIYGSHLEYQNRTILAILNLCVTVMPPIKFWLNPTYRLGGDVVWRISRWLPSEQNNFSNSESLCHCDASHQVSALSDFWFGRCCLKNFKMATMAILDIATEWFEQFWISMLCRCLPSSFGSIWLMVWEEMSFEEFQDGHHGGHLGYRNGMILSILKLHVATMPLTKFQLNLTYGSGGDVENVKS